MCSQFSIGKHWSVAQYSSNNSWLYNGNNGELNNNNKYNTNSARALDYNIWDYAGREDFLLLLYEFYDAYYVCRTNKRSKSSQLNFEYHFAEYFIHLVISVYTNEYIPSEAIAFIIDNPRIREVIAAFFGDRIVQTWYVSKMLPHLEKDWFDDDSYSCRVGKGGLRAALKLKEYIKEESCNYAFKCYVVKRDLRAFFMSIDPKILEEKLVDFIWEHFDTDEKLRNMLCYVTRIIYCGFPQEHCIIKSHPLAWKKLEYRKSMFGKVIGLPIGNITSQMAANFITTFYLDILRKMGYKFVHYTDDTAIVVKDIKKWNNDSKIIEKYISEELHLEWHPHKIYCQDISKGVEFLGYKIRYDRMLPSDRIAHNYIWTTECAVERYMNKTFVNYADKLHFMQSFNSYGGLLKWCNSHRLTERAVNAIKESPITDIYDIESNYKIQIRNKESKMNYYKYMNKTRKSNLIKHSKKYEKDF